MLLLLLSHIQHPQHGGMEQSSRHATLQKPNTEFVQFKRLLKAFLFGETAAH